MPSCNSFPLGFILENFESSIWPVKIKDSIRRNEIPEIKWVEFSITLSLSQRLASILSSKGLYILSNHKSRGPDVEISRETE